MSETTEVDLNGIRYSLITFEEFAAATKYLLFGAPRYRWAGDPVVVLGTFSAKKLTFTRKDFARSDAYVGNFAYLKPPSGGDAGPMITIGPAFDDAAWAKCKTLWEAYKAEHPGEIPRLFFFGTVVYDRKVFRSHHLAVDTILFANGHSGDAALPDVKTLHELKGRQEDAGEAISIKKAPPLPFDPGL